MAERFKLRQKKKSCLCVILLIFNILLAQKAVQACNVQPKIEDGSIEGDITPTLSTGVQYFKDSTDAEGNPFELRYDFRLTQSDFKPTISVDDYLEQASDDDDQDCGQSEIFLGLFLRSVTFTLKEGETTEEMSENEFIDYQYQGGTDKISPTCGNYCIAYLDQKSGNSADNFQTDLVMSTVLPKNLAFADPVSVKWITFYYELRLEDKPADQAMDQEKGQFLFQVRYFLDDFYECILTPVTYYVNIGLTYAIDCFYQGTELFG